MEREKKIEILNQLKSGEINIDQAKKMFADLITKEQKKHLGRFVICTYNANEPDKITCGNEIITSQEFNSRFPDYESRSPMDKTGVMLIEIALPPNISL